MLPEYNLRDHWERVAMEIGGRDPGNVVAGDDSPFTRYARDRFLGDFQRVLPDFAGLTVLEVGCGPGGNLIQTSFSQPAKLVGCDISAAMLRLARQNLTHLKARIQLCRIDGASLPFADRVFNVAFTVTVLQHVTTEATVDTLLSELARVTSERLLLYEDTHPWRWEKYSHVARRVSNYRQKMAGRGFDLVEVNHLSTAVSHITTSTLRRLTSLRGRREGEPIPASTLRGQALLLKFTKVFDRLLPAPVGLTKMLFVRR